MPTTQGYDPGFVGAAYEAPNYLQDTQRCINWYPEISPDPHAKEVISLMGAPGTLDLVTLAAGKPVRQAWVLPGGTRTLAVCGANVYLVTQGVAGALTATSVGTLLTPIGPVQIRDNGYVAVIVDGAYGYTYLINTGAFAQITDPGFTGFASRVAMVDGWFAFNQANSRNWYISPQYLGINGNPNQGLQNTPWDATQFAVADATGDLLVSLIEDQRLIWLPKERATEVWYDAGAQFFTFNRMQGVLLQIGCAAPQSVARVSKGLMWLAANERGQNFVIRTQGFDYDRVSTHAIDFAISSYATVSDALGWTYIENGHEFYVLTFPTADVTWVYDTLSGLWHERLSFDPVLGQYHRHRGNCVINFQNRRLIGTWDTGALAWMDRSLATDGVNPLISWRRTGHIWDKQSRRRVFHHQLQIETSPGVGTAGLIVSSGGGSVAPAANQTVLLHFDGANGSIIIADAYPNLWLPHGGAKLSTAWAKFGPSSLLLNGSTDWITTTSDLFRPGSADFTFECFANATSVTGSQCLFGTQSNSVTFDGIIFFLNAGQLTMLCANSTNTAWLVAQTAGAIVAANVPHHYAFVRFGNNFTAYLDGVGQFTVTASGSIGSTAAGLAIGAARVPGTSNWAGYIDEARVSMGVARYTANFTPPTAPFTPALAPLTKVWENLSTGFAFTGFTYTRSAFVTGFTPGVVRAVALTHVTHTSNDGNAYRLNLATGAAVANDVPTSFENEIASGASFFKDLAGNGMGLVMQHISGNCGAFSHFVGDTSSGNLPNPPMSSDTGASLYICNSTTAAIIGDALAAITRPSAIITGTWRAVAVFPCATWQHVGIITKDSGGTGNYWLHVVAVSSGGACSQVNYYQFTLPSDGSVAAGLAAVGGTVGAWTDQFFDRASSAMLESSLTSMWTSDGAGGGPTVRYFQVGTNGQVTQTAALLYPATIGVGWASIYADNGVMAYMADNFAHSIALTQQPASAQVNPAAKPHMILKWSDDGGKTFGNEKQLPMGQIGQFKNRSVAYNLGYSRDRVYDLKVIDAVPRDLIGATLMTETEI